MKIRMFLLSLIVWASSAQAQNMISMSAVHPQADTARADRKELAIRYPALRQFSIVANNFGYGDFDAKLDEDPLAMGRTRTTRINSFFSTPVKQWKGNSLSATLFYTYTSIQLREVVNSLSTPQLASLTSEKSTIALSLNYSRSDRIFNHPVIYSVVVSAISDNLSSVRRFNFNGSFSFPLKRTPNTSLSVGALLLIDPSAPVPVEPLINYYHKFNNSGLELIVDIPTGINLKKQLWDKAWILIGSNQNSYTTFYSRQDALLHGKASYNTIELKSGPAFELLVAKQLILGIGGGVNSFFAARIFDGGQDYGDAAVVSKNKTVPYVNFCVSLLPF